MPYRLLLLAGALLGSLLDLAAQTQLPVDTLLPIGRVTRVYEPESVPEYLGYRQPWIYILLWRDSAGIGKTNFTWRFETFDDTVRVMEFNGPRRTMLDANGDGHRDFYDSLLVLGSDTGWVEDTGSRNIVDLGPGLRVLDLDNDRYDDLYVGRTVYWGDSLEPLRRTSKVINPDRGPQSGVAYVNRLQGIPAIATAYDVEGSIGTRRRYSAWALRAEDVNAHRDTLRVLDTLWRTVFFVDDFVPVSDLLFRNGQWLSLGYDDWVAFDTAGSSYYAHDVDTLLLSGKYIAGTLMLPLSHPPTLDSTLQLTISGESVLSVRQWLTPEQIIPSETKAFYLMPQTQYATQIRQLMSWPDVTGDSIPEVAVHRESKDGVTPRSPYDDCLEIYDIVGTAASYVVMPDDASHDNDVSVSQGRIVWTSVTGGDVTVRYYEASGRLLMQSRIAAETLATEGIAPTPDVGKGIRLVELVDSTGRTRRTTMVVR